MEELCGNLTSSDYTFPENLVASDCYNPFSPPGVSCFPVFGSDQQLVFSGSNSASDSDSMVVHEMNTSTSTNTNTNTTTSGSGSKEEVSGVIRAKICSHPLYPYLLQAYIDCQKVGAPPEIANVLDEILRETDRQRSSTTLVSSSVGEDPELDDFMETYCDILLKFKSDLSRPFQEATDFLSNVEAQFNSLCSSSFQVSDEAVGTPEEDAASIEEVELPAGCTQQNEDRELKDKLLRKYSGYISTLKQEFSKKKKNGKLPKEARQILLAWWNVHYRWPYPTEADKVLLANATGLDQKQINNWFINQRKRHWKPSENMQFSVVDSLYGPFLHD